MSEISKTDECPCCSGKTYGDCCEPIVSGAKDAPTAESLMRARYTAYVVGAIDFIVETCTTNNGERDIDRKATEDWSHNSTWHGLKILRTEKGSEADEEGLVEFEAKYTLRHMKDTHHELAAFKKVDGKWLYATGRLSVQTVVRDGKKVGRNEPCPCGSGKKYKQCCGK